MMSSLVHDICIIFCNILFQGVRSVYQSTWWAVWFMAFVLYFYNILFQGVRSVYQSTWWAAWYRGLYLAQRALTATQPQPHPTPPRHSSTRNTEGTIYSAIRIFLRIDSYFSVHMEYKRPDGVLKIPWSAHVQWDDF